MQLFYANRCQFKALCNRMVAHLATLLSRGSLPAKIYTNTKWIPNEYRRTHTNIATTKTKPNANGFADDSIVEMPPCTARFPRVCCWCRAVF